MPVSSNLAPLASILPIIASRLARTTAGSMPRSASLAPSSRMTMSGFSASAQSSRARPPAVVSPDTPALTTWTTVPSAFSRASRRDGKAASAGSPSPAVRLSPNASTSGTRAAACPDSASSSNPASQITVAFIILDWAASPGPSTARASSCVEKAPACAISSGPLPHPVCAARMISPLPPGSPLVLLEGVALTLASAAGPVDILRGVSLRIEPGETVALVGPSGSGKSSLMMVLAGLERPSAGRAMLAGHDLGTLDENALARLRRGHVGIVFQAFHLLPTMTALENVAIPLELAGAPDALSSAATALERVGLGHRLAHYPGQLSGGEQQR